MNEIAENAALVQALAYVNQSAVAGANCANCALYQGKPTDKAAACALFPGKLVAGPGWCSAWAKKA